MFSEAWAELDWAEYFLTQLNAVPFPNTPRSWALTLNNFTFTYCSITATSTCMIWNMMQSFSHGTSASTHILLPRLLHSFLHPVTITRQCLETGVRRLKTLQKGHSAGIFICFHLPLCHSYMSTYLEQTVVGSSISVHFMLFVLHNGCIKCWLFCGTGEKVRSKKFLISLELDVAFIVIVVSILQVNSSSYFYFGSIYGIS